MKSLPLLMQKVSRLFHQKRMFWRILVLYLAGSILLLTIFSGVLTVYLTWQATQETISRNNDALGQAYAAADYILNTAYETYYKMYQSYEATDILFADTPTTDAALTAAKLFKQINTGIDCVESVYFVNRAADRVYASDGRIATLDEFYDPQALRLFQFYNENSNTLFLPRKTTFPDAADQQQEHSYITLIFSRRNAVMVPMGGMVVNLDEERLIDLITQDLETADDLYIVSENGSILANADPKKVNTSIYGSDLWEQITAEGDKQEFSFHTQWDSQNCLVTVRNAPRLRFSFLRITPHGANQRKRGLYPQLCAGLLGGVSVCGIFAGRCGKPLYLPPTVRSGDEPAQPHRCTTRRNRRGCADGRGRIPWQNL